MSVDQARRHVGTPKVDRLSSLISPTQPDDLLATDGDVGGFDLAGKHVDQLCVAQHQVGRLVASSHTDHIC